ncbi:uncharacterized protein METZ01_LOCUS303297 [marine metagenome]|uniref:Uncharacterized protein n=1 Tax=marine metagenome TaxID=408172 RepID=A0A382MN88_9ZZZZ
MMPLLWVPVLPVPQQPFMPAVWA